MTRTRLLYVVQALMFIGALLAAVLLSRTADWTPLLLTGLLAVTAVFGDVSGVTIKDYRLSGSAPALVLSMILLGPAPAVAIGVATMAIDGLRTRPRRDYLVNNLTAFATFPLFGAGLDRLLNGLGGPHSDVRLAATVLVVFMAANFVNFLLISTFTNVRIGKPVRPTVRTMYLPVLTEEVTAAMLTAGVAIAVKHLGAGFLVVVAVLGAIFLRLVGTALAAQQRGDELAERSQQLAALHLGLIGTVMQTLSLRDRMTARHSAAVARFSRAVARELGAGEEEQELIHTAGLLHDIGKFIFPDSILFAATGLTDAQYELVRRHPAQGAELVAGIEGYGPVAEIIRAHHERVDGRGYPDGLADGEIPLGSRIIAVADTYDVMTARDSYRTPVSSAEAIAELRRVSGSQLDPHVVGAFIRLAERGDLVFQHADDADFERELNLERRVLDYAAPRQSTVTTR